MNRIIINKNLISSIEVFERSIYKTFTWKDEKKFLWIKKIKKGYYDKDDCPIILSNYDKPYYLIGENIIFYSPRVMITLTNKNQFSSYFKTNDDAHKYKDSIINSPNQFIEL